MSDARTQAAMSTIAAGIIIMINCKNQLWFEIETSFR